MNNDLLFNVVDIDISRGELLLTQSMNDKLRLVRIKRVPSTVDSP